MPDRQPRRQVRKLCSNNIHYTFPADLSAEQLKPDRFFAAVGVLTNSQRSFDLIYRTFSPLLVFFTNSTALIRAFAAVGVLTNSQRSFELIYRTLRSTPNLQTRR